MLRRVGQLASRVVYRVSGTFSDRKNRHVAGSAAVRSGTSNPTPRGMGTSNSEVNPALSSMPA